MGSKSSKVDKQAQKRIKDSKFKGKILQYANLYGQQGRTLLKQWADKNIDDNYNSVTYTSYDYPSYRKSKQDWINALEKAYEKGWNIIIIEFTDVQLVNNTEIVSLIYKFPFIKDGKQCQIYFELDAVFDIASGKWKKSVYKQYGSKSPLRYADYVAPTYTAPRYDTEPTSNKSYDDAYKKNFEQSKRDDQERREKYERDQKEQRDRERRERQSREAYQRQQQQAAERERRYQEQQRQFRENMRRQEQAQADYRRQQQQQAQQRYREAQQARINSRRY